MSIEISKWYILFGIAISLSMDAFAVSVTNGLIIKDLKWYQALKIAFSFGFFQALMPIIGWLLGSTFSIYIVSVDHWIAFILLVFIGGKMIWESKKIEDNCQTKTCNDLPTLMFFSIATSIDALAVGLSYAILKVEIIIPAIIIGVITFIICLIGTLIGKKIGHLFENKLELIGGIILILIGFKILLEHLFKN